MQFHRIRAFNVFYKVYCVFSVLQDSVSYPLAAGGSQGRRFRDGLCEWVCQLVQRCRHSLLYDEFLFSSLIAFLTGLADSQVRAFRHTSTLIGEGFPKVYHI